VTAHGVVYCVDTSAFLEAYTRHFPPRIFPTLWSYIDDLIAADRIVAPDLVLDELEVIEDDVYNWAKQRHQIFKAPSYYITAEVSVIAATFPALAQRDPTKNKADPFVVALAKHNGYAVVAEERGGSDQDPKIPYMCKRLGVPFYNLIQMMETEGWTF
jgi:hypothetical protein